VFRRGKLIIIIIIIISRHPRQRVNPTDVYLSMYYEQALVRLSNREIVDATTRWPLHCTMANNRVFLYLCWPNFINHLAAVNYNGHWTTDLGVNGFV